MAAPTITLSIVILNYKTKNLLRQCLDGIYRFPPQQPFEVIVVDNDSGDHTIALVNQFYPSVRTINAPNHGHADGNNRGIQLARGRYILLLNTDIVIFNDSLTNLVTFADNHPRAGIIGPQLLNPDGSIQETARAFSDWRTPLYRRTFLGKTSRGRAYIATYLLQDQNDRDTRAVPWVQGSALMIRHELLATIGLLDPTFFLYFADDDLCRRAWIAGWQVVYFTNTKIVHYFHRQSHTNPWLGPLIHPVTRAHIRDWLAYLWKYRGQTTPPVPSRLG